MLRSRVILRNVIKRQISRARWGMVHGRVERGIQCVVREDIEKLGEEADFELLF